MFFNLAKIRERNNRSNLGNDDGADSDSEKGNSRAQPRSLMQTLTNADNNLTNRQFEQSLPSQRMSDWRHPKANLNRMRSLDLTETGQGDHLTASINAAPSSSSHRSRAHNAFNKFVHQTMDFTRRTFVQFVNLTTSFLFLFTRSYSLLNFRRSRNERTENIRRRWSTEEIRTSMAKTRSSKKTTN